MLNRSEVREALRHDWPLVEVAIPLVLILALGVLDIVPDKAVILAATLAVLVKLAAAGAYADGSNHCGNGRKGLRFSGMKWLVATILTPRFTASYRTCSPIM